MYVPGTGTRSLGHARSPIEGYRRQVLEGGAERERHTHTRKCRHFTSTLATEGKDRTPWKEEQAVYTRTSHVLHERPTNWHGCTVHAPPLPWPPPPLFLMDTPTVNNESSTESYEMSSYERNLHTTQELPKTIELWHGSRTTETVNVKRECGEREDTGEARIHSQVDHRHVPERELSKDHGKDFRLQDSLNSKTHLFESDQECSPCPCPHTER